MSAKSFYPTGAFFENPCYKDMALMPLPSNPNQKYAIRTEWQLLMHDNNPYLQDKSGGWGVVCGINSNKLECLDLDAKEIPVEERDKIWQEFIDFTKEINIFDTLVVETTPSGGRHVYFRCFEIDKQPTKAYARDENGWVIWEIRGDLGYVKIFPSPGYNLVKGDFNDIPVYSKEVRQQILDKISSYNRFVKTAPSAPKHQNIIAPKDPNAPWHLFNEAYDPIPLLEKWGWTQVEKRFDGGIRLLRPGHTDSQSSASWNHDGNKRFTCFTSSSTHFEPNVSYSAFDIFKILECKGDNREAVNKIKEMGYVSDKDKEKTVDSFLIDLEEEYNQEEYFKEFVSNTRITFDEYKNRRPEEEGVLLYMDIMPNDSTIPRPYIFCQRKYMTTIQSGASGGKTTLVRSILSQFYSEQCRNLSVYKSKYCKKVLVYDSENPREQLYSQYESIRKFLGLSEESMEGIFNQENVIHITHKDQKVKNEYKQWIKKNEGKDVIDWIFGIAVSNGIDLIILDNVDIIVRGEKEEANSTKAGEYIEKMSDYCVSYDIGVLATIHTNPFNNKARGWLGTFCWQKSDTALALKKDQNHEEFGNFHKFYGESEYAKSRHGLHDAVQYNNRYGFTYSEDAKMHILAIETSKEEMKEQKELYKLQVKQERIEKKEKTMSMFVDECNTIIEKELLKVPMIKSSKVKQLLEDQITKEDLTPISKTTARNILIAWKKNYESEYSYEELGGNHGFMISRLDKVESQKKSIDIDREIYHIIIDSLEQNIFDDEVLISVIADIADRRLNCGKEYATERIMKVVIENLNGYIVKDECISRI